MVHVVERLFFTEDVPIKVPPGKIQEGEDLRTPFLDFVKMNFTIRNCNTLYPTALKLQDRSWITYCQQQELIDKPKDLHSQRVKVNR